MLVSLTSRFRFLRMKASVWPDYTVMSSLVRSIISEWIISKKAVKNIYESIPVSQKNTHTPHPKKKECSMHRRDHNPIKIVVF